MFGFGNPRENASGIRPTTGDVARLAGYDTLDDAALHALADQATIEALPAGTPPARWFEGHRVFLHSGEVEMRTENGQRAFLSSVSRPARFPLPSPHRAQTRCVEATTFIRVPLPGAEKTNDSTPTAVAPLPPYLASLRRLLDVKLASGDLSLPAMPDLAIKLNSAMRAPDSRHNDLEIAKLIQLDPALASKLIHVVNSAAFSFARKAGSVRQAITRLGRDRVRNITTTFLMRHAFTTQSGGLRKRAQATWLRSCHVAAISFTLAKQLPSLDPDRAMLAGLIHLIGTLPVLALANHQPALFTDRALLDNAIETLRRPLGQLVLQRWAFDDDMLDAVQQAGNWHRIGDALPDYTDVVLLAQLHADMGRPGGAKRPPMGEVPAFQKLEMGKLTPNKSIQLLEDAEQEIAELRRILARNG